MEPTRTTKRLLAWSDGSPVEVGQRVGCERSSRARGTWARYAGRTGIVVQVVGFLSHGGETAWIGEVGVELAEPSVVAWFRVGELVPLAAHHRVKKAPLSPAALVAA